ncbi:DUF6531 domain-containing protein [Hyalangium minutum]|nr:DUF6531 domain-containing protein [Hyalangium minutum]
MDPILGVDIHLIITPPGPVIPIPHPHIGMVFDPFDYIPVIGSTVNVNFLPRAQAGTGGVELPPHFPIGGVFAKPPANENETFMGSATVAVDGDAFTNMTLPVLSCQDIGMPSPPRKRGPAAKTLLLPSSIVLSIPAGPPVRVGGPPTISLMGMLTQFALGALLKGLKKLRKLQKASRKMKKLSDRIHKAADKLMDKLKLSKRARDWIHKRICNFTGHPVDVATGRTVTEALDWEIPGPLPLKFERNYSSSLSWRDSTLGYGWSHSLDMAVWEEDAQVVYRSEDGREIEFPATGAPRGRMPVGTEIHDPINRLTLRRLSESRWSIETHDGLVHDFRQLVPQGRYHVVRSQNRQGDFITYKYDEHGCLEWLTDSVDRRVRFEHDNNHRLTKVWLPHPTQPGLVLHNHYHYSDAGDLLEASDALGNHFRYTYSNHLLTRETDRSGLSFHFEYDGKTAEAWCIRTWGDGGIYDHSLAYDKTHEITLVTNSLGHTTTYHCRQGLVVREIDPLGGEWKHEYDQFLRQTLAVNPHGHETHFEYDSRGNRVKIHLPDDSSFTLSYDSRNLLTGAIDTTGGVWNWRHDLRGNLIARTNPQGALYEYHYSGGLLALVTGPEGQCAAFEYDSYKNLTCITAPDGTKTVYKYDRLGRIINARDPSGAEQLIGYDALGRQTRIAETNGTIYDLKYNPEGYLLEIADPHETVHLGYVGFHKLASVEQSGRRIRYEYDTEDNLVAVVNEHGERLVFELDPRGLVSREIGFDGAIRTYSYDLAGRLAREQLPSGRSSTYEYDPMGRPTHVRYSDNSFRRFKYRPDGVISAAQNEHVNISFQHDALGRLIEERSGESWIKARYDTMGERVELSSSHGAKQLIKRSVLGDVASFHYGSRERSWEVAFSRDPAGLELGRNLPCNVMVRWARGALGEPLEQRTHGSQGLLEQRSFAWRSDSTLNHIDDLARGTTRFEYDLHGRLASAHYPDGQTRHSTTGTARNPPEGACFNLPGGQFSSGHGVQCTYDADGNLIRKSVPGGMAWQYSWDDAGTLREAKRSDGLRVHFTYDPFGRRISKRCFVKTVSGPEKSSSSTHWVWDQDAVLHEISSNSGITTWLFEPESFALLGKEDSSGRYWAVTDQLGSPTELYDESGSLAWRSHLDILGVASTETYRTTCPWRWPGQYEDGETGLYYNYHRYYDPSIGRYISQDPIRIEGGLDLYAYVSDPLCWMDPLGLMGIINRGGAFRVLDALKKSGEVGHHMPQNRFLEQIKLSRGKGPALGMTDADHALTRTFAGKGKATMRIDKDLLFRERLYKDIRDVRKLFGGKYNKGLREMLDYAKTLPEYHIRRKKDC